MNLIDDTIYDIKICEGKIGFVRKHDKINSEYIERVISEFSYDPVFLVKDEAVEQAKIPPFITAFYLYIFYKNTIPSPEQLWETYFNKYFVYNVPKEDNNTCTLKSPKMRVKFCGSKVFDCFALKSRLFRAYPSLVHDYHFYHICNESNLFEKVTYSLNADYYDGQDLVLYYASEKFIISMFTGTERGEYFKVKKNNRHDYSKYKEILLGISKEDCKQVGDFYLYKEDHACEIMDKIHKYLKGD